MLKEFGQISEELTLDVRKEIDIEASPEVTFDSLIEQLSTQLETPDGEIIPMKFEPWPGGRWYRDLGDNNGHLWGIVQVIKKPVIVEIYGPLFMSYPVISHVQYRLTETQDGTNLSLTHRALGFVEPDHREGVHDGWEEYLQSVKRRSLKAIQH